MHTRPANPKNINIETTSHKPDLPPSLNRHTDRRHGNAKPDGLELFPFQQIHDTDAGHSWYVISKQIKNLSGFLPVALNISGNRRNPFHRKKSFDARSHAR